jgi:hypothetical protein
MSNPLVPMHHITPTELTNGCQRAMNGDRADEWRHPADELTGTRAAPALR